MVIVCILKGEMPFKMHKIIFFPEKDIIKKKQFCNDPLPETRLFFYLA